MHYSMNVKPIKFSKKSCHFSKHDDYCTEDLKALVCKLHRMLTWWTQFRPSIPRQSVIALIGSETKSSSYVVRLNRNWGQLRWNCRDNVESFISKKWWFLLGCKVRATIISLELDPSRDIAAGFCVLMKKCERNSPIETDVAVKTLRPSPTAISSG